MKLITNGRLITRDAEGRGYYEHGAVAYEGARIAEVGEEAALRAKYPDAEIVDAKGGVIMPAFINAHTHIYSALARGLSIVGNNPTNFYEVLDGTWWAIDRHLMMDGTKASATALYIDSIKQGVTTVFDHHASYGEIPGTLHTIAEESKRLGLCQKPLFVVPNHLTEQWASEFLRLYPSANILAATKKDFEPRNRKKFCGRIATGDYDAIIIGHSQFERIPVSQERQERLLQEQIAEIEDGLAELKASRAERFTIKSLERTKKGLETRLKKLQDTTRKDDVITFEQLGVDRLYVDEAHSFKNLFLYTKMRNVAGLSTSDAQKSSDMLLKCRYIDEITGSRGVVFATGTPVSNSMTVRP